PRRGLEVQRRLGLIPKAVPSQQGKPDVVSRRNFSNLQHRFGNRYGVLENVGLRFVRAADWLDGEMIVGPPWPRRPVSPAEPNIAIVIDKGEHVPQSRNAGCVRGDADLAQEAAAAIAAAPGGECAEAGD